MKIMRPHFEGAVGQSGQARRFDVNHVVLVLERPFDKEKLAARDNQSVPVVKIWCNYDVGDASLVLHRNEDKSLGCAWPLPGDDAAGHTDKLSVAACSQFLGGEDIAAAQLGSAIVHGMLSDRKSGPSVVRDETLFDFHLLQGTCRGIFAERVTILPK